MQLETIRTQLPDACQQSDGSITFECPICRAEDHPGKPAKLYANGAISCVRAVAGGTDFNRAHCRPIREMLGLMDSPNKAFITKVLFEGRLTVQCSQVERGKVRLVARNCNSTLNRDVISLDRAKERNDFIKALPDFDTQERKEIDQTLKQLADEYESAIAAIDEEEAESETKHVIFAELPDGRLIDQIAGGRFAVYDKARGEVTYQREVKTDETVYRPLNDPCLLQGDLHLPETLIEYGDVNKLDAEIEACIRRYSDVPGRELKLAAKYARLSYLADKLYEISYFRASGLQGFRASGLQGFRASGLQGFRASGLQGFRAARQRQEQIYLHDRTSLYAPLSAYQSDRGHSLPNHGRLPRYYGVGRNEPGARFRRRPESHSDSQLRLPTLDQGAEDVQRPER